MNLAVSVIISIHFKNINSSMIIFISRIPGSLGFRVQIKEKTLIITQALVLLHTRRILNPPQSLLL